MAEYIEREKIVSIIKADIRQCEEDAECAFGDEAYLQAVDSRKNGAHYILREIEHRPAADVVEVVRCKDCEHFKAYSDPLKGFYGECMVRESDIGEDDYCSYGIRKEGAEE